MLTRLQNEMITALKAKDTERLSVIRMLISEVKNESFKEGSKRSPDECILGYLKKLTKAVEEFADKPKFSDKVRREIKIVSEFVPKQMTRLEIIETIVKAASLTYNGQYLSINPLPDLSITMKTVMPFVKGKADGKLVKEIVDWFNNDEIYEESIGKVSVANLLRMNRFEDVIKYAKKKYL